MRAVGYMALGLAALFSSASASFAHAPRVLEPCKSAGAGSEPEERQTDQRLGRNTGVSVAVPIGRVCVAPEGVDGEPSYVRRMKAKEGMAIVEVSTTPFMPILAGVDASIGRPNEQPTGW